MTFITIATILIAAVSLNLQTLKQVDFIEKVRIEAAKQKAEKEAEEKKNQGNNQGTGKPPTSQPPSSPSGNWWEYPAEIKPVTKSGDDLLVLVNKGFTLGQYQPGNLQTVSGTECRQNSGLSMRSQAIQPLKDLCWAAKNDGIDLKLQSAYRSYQTQVSTYNHWVAVYGGSRAEADKVSARPGHSQHQLGTTMDFTTSSAGDQLNEAFNNSAASSWLLNNGWKYGFVIAYPAGAETRTGYSYEGWHYRFIGIENAAAFRSANTGSGIVLDEWLRTK